MVKLARRTLAAKWRRGLTDAETVEVLDLQDRLRAEGDRERQLAECRRLCRLVVKSRHPTDHPWFEDWAEDLLCGLLTGGYFDLWRGRPRAKWRLWVLLRLYELEKPEHRLSDVRAGLELLAAPHAGAFPDPDPRGVGVSFLPAEARRKFRTGELPELCVDNDGSAVSAALWQALDDVLDRGDPDDLIAGYAALSATVDSDRREVIRNHAEAQSKIETGRTPKKDTRPRTDA